MTVQIHTPPNDELFRLLVEQSKEHAIVLTDAEGRITGFNPAAERIFGFRESDVRGKPVLILFTPEEIERGLAENELVTARAHGSAEDDRWMARRDHSVFWANGVMLALRNGNGDIVGFGKILRDRTDLMEQLETLRNQVLELDASDHNKDVFLKTLSHELRNPLAALTHAIEIIRKGSPLASELEYPVDVIDRQLAMLHRLVDDMMDLSRIGAGKIELKKERVALNDVIHRAVAAVGPQVRERRHQLDVLFPPVPIVVEADPVRLEQVFVNLLSNATKYTPEGGRIWIKGTTEGNQAVVHVQDTGIGISHDILPRIFDLFTQAESSRAQSQGGLGIGLSLVKNLVTLHGGSVQVRSDGEGTGSEFSVRLPFRRIPAGA